MFVRWVGSVMVANFFQHFMSSFVCKFSKGVRSNGFFGSEEPHFCIDLISFYRLGIGWKFSELIVLNLFFMCTFKSCQLRG